jgi:DNA primase
MSVIDEVKDRLDVVDVVSDYVTLQKSGRNFKALCPFHTEKTPSFFVFPERGTWHCFGSCGIGGDVFSFIMKKEGIEFGEALKLLANRAGVTLVSKQKDQVKERLTERLYQINEAAASYYHNLLLDGETGQAARDYLKQRGISTKTIDDFQLGLSPDRWDALHRHLEGKGYKRDEMVKAGLAAEKEGGGLRDQFHNRLMIPIRNEAGRVVGFGARALDDSHPKYINSPQTEVFDKSGLLYGLDRAKEAIRERNQAIIVEGYLDVLTAHQHAITNVVAPMGTSLTPKQVSVIKRLTKNIALALDADSAGEQATLRGLEVAREALSRRTDRRERAWLEGDSRLQGKLKVILMPRGKDPDEVIRENPDDWVRLVNEATPVMEYFFKAAISKHDMGDESEKAAVVDQLLPIIMEIADKAEKELYLKRLSRVVGVSEKTLVDKAAQLKPTAREKLRTAVPLPATPISSHPLEEDCLAMLLQFPDLREQGLALSPEHFEGTENREIFIAWSNSADMESLRHSIDTSLHEHLELLVAKALPPATERERETALADYTRRLWEERLRRLKALEAVLISEAEGEGDREAINEIQEQVETLLQKALEPTTQLKEVFEKAKHERKGVSK